MKNIFVLTVIVGNTEKYAGTFSSEEKAEEYFSENKRAFYLASEYRINREVLDDPQKDYCRIVHLNHKDWFPAHMTEEEFWNKKMEG